MNKNDITQAELKVLVHYDPETGVFIRLKSRHRRFRNMPTGTTQNTGYWAVHVKTKNGNRQYLAHRLAWLYMTGSWPVYIDHINRDKLDNRFCNLREVTKPQNGQNRGLQSNNKSGHRGVFKHPKNISYPWYAYIKVDGEHITLGYYRNKSNAVKVRKQAEIDYGFLTDLG